MNFFFFLPERFFHFRGIHKYMTDTQKHIIDLVMDPRSVHDLAVFQLRTPGKVRSKVFSSFVDSWVVHSELGLSHNLYPLTLQNLSDAFRNAGVDSQIQGDRLHAKLSNVEISVYADPDCTTIISADAILARVQPPCTSLRSGTSLRYKGRRRVHPDTAETLSLGKDQHEAPGHGGHREGRPAGRIRPSR